MQLSCSRNGLLCVAFLQVRWYDANDALSVCELQNGKRGKANCDAYLAALIAHFGSTVAARRERTLMTAAVVQVAASQARLLPLDTRRFSLCSLIIELRGVTNNIIYMMDRGFAVPTS